MPAAPESIALATQAAQAASEKKAEDICVLDVSEQLYITDCFVVCTGDNERMVNSIAEEIEEKLGTEGNKPIRREGNREGRWVLLDYGDIVVHVQRRAEREFYALEKLWHDCPNIDVEGVETTDPNAGDGEADASLHADTIEDLPLAGREPDADEL